MPKDITYKEYRYGSIYEDELIKRGDVDKLKSNIGEVLNSWESGASKSPKAIEAIEYLTNGIDQKGAFSVNIPLAHSMDPLRDAGLLSKKRTYPKVDDMIEAGRHIYFKDTDGNLVTYTDKYFKDNATVKELKEKEEAAGAGSSCGFIMAVHMAEFLSTTDKTVIMAPKKGEKIVMLPEGDDSLRNGPELNEQLADRVESLYSVYKSRPTVPERPVEKSRARRFFCFFGWPHSKDYKEQKAAYDDAVTKREDYDERMEQINRLKSQLKPFTKITTMMDAVSKAEEAQAKEDIYSEIQRREAQKKSDGKEFMGKLTAMESLKKIDESPLPPFKNATTGALLEIANTNPNPRDRNEWIDAEIAFPNRAAEAIYSVEECGRVMREIGKMTPENKKAARNAIKGEFQVRQNESMRLFKDVFGMEATPANVQRVIEAVDLEKHVKNRLEKEEMTEYKGKKTLPKVNERNCATMTLLLMGGIKTSVCEGKILSAAEEERFRVPTAEEIARERDNESGLTVYNPMKAARVEEPGDPVQPVM